MTQLSKEELLFLSNLMHIREEGEFAEGEFVFNNIWEDKNKGLTIGDLIGGIDTEKLSEEYADKTFDGEISGAEWAAMLEKFQDDDAICNLKIVGLERDDKNALCKTCLLIMKLLISLQKYVQLC